MPSEARQKKIMEKLNRAQKCSILGPQNLGSRGGPRAPPLDPHLPPRTPPKTGTSHEGLRDFRSELTQNTPAPSRPLPPKKLELLMEDFASGGWCVENTAVYPEDTISFQHGGFMFFSCLSLHELQRSVQD